MNNPFTRVAVLLTLIYALMPNSALAKNWEVTTPEQLSAALEKALPGDVITINANTWKDIVIELKAKGSVSKPITIRAKKPGQFILTGSSRIVFSSPYIVIDGFYFKDGALERENVVTFNSSYCRFTNSAIENYNPAKASDSYYWVYFNGPNNRVDKCYFYGKNHAQPLIGNDHTDSRQNTVDHCYFKDIPYTDGGNGREIFRIWGYGGNEELGADGAYFTIEYNLFDHADGEGAEIISLKSNYNVVRYNTIIATRGGIVGRSGNYNTIESNFIFGQGREGTSGIRVAGQGHKVMNNYIEGVEGDGLILMAGEYYDTALTESYEPIARTGTRLGRVPRYGHVRNGIFAHNTIVDAGGVGITMASGYMGSWPNQQRILLPEGNTFANNIVTTRGGGAVIDMPTQERTAPLDTMTFTPNVFQSNIFFGGPVKMEPAPSGITMQSPELGSDKLRMLQLLPGSPAINNGTGKFVNEDIQGQMRDSKPDIGADESTSTKIKIRPLTPEDVGPAWMKKKRT